MSDNNNMAGIDTAELIRLVTTLTEELQRRTPAQAEDYKPKHAASPEPKAKLNSRLTVEQQTLRKEIFDATRNGGTWKGMGYRKAMASVGIPTGKALRKLPMIAELIHPVDFRKG